MTTPSAAATIAAEGGSKDKNDLANLQQTRSQLINMLTLLDPVTAASLSQSQQQQQQQQQTLGPGLSQVLIPLLAPILQPLDQLKQQQQPHFANTIRTALHQAGELAKALSTDIADDNKDNNTKRKNPSPPIQQALDLIHRATSATTSSSSEDVLHPILLLRKRKRQAEDAQRAARRRRTADTVAFIESTSLSSISASRIDSQVPPAKKQRSRQLCFPPPPPVNLNAHTEELLLRSQTLESYLAAIQAHPAWKQPRLASHSTSNNTLGAGAQQKDESDVRIHRITLSVYSSALSASTSRWSSLLYSSSSGTDSERGQIETSSSSSAAILVQIEGVLQALLTLGLRRSDLQNKPRVVLVHANIRSALEMEPLDDGKAGSAGGGGGGGGGAGMGSAQQQSQGALPGSAHLSSSSPLHRSLSSDLMAFLARERERERLSVTATERSDLMEEDGDGEREGPAIWREVGMALMFVRGLRTVEDSSVPASLLSSPEEVGGDTRRKTTTTLGFTHFLDMDRTQDGSAEEEETEGGGKGDAVGAGRSLDFQFGQAPVRWAWCAASQEGGSSLDGSSGEWLAFNYAAAATAPLDTAATGDGLMGMGMNGIGMGMNMGMGMGLGMGMGMGMNMGMNMMPLPMSMQMPLPLPMSMQMPMAPPMQMPVSMPLPMPMGMPSMPMSMSMPMPMSNPFGGHPDPSSSGAGPHSSGGMMGISMPMSMPSSSIAPS
ncbi:hypothetical protein CF327_g6614 [Tilletia walkeri]|nr:hypothetical protein CF327_g6614 [Tilletia walkeri]